MCPVCKEVLVVSDRPMLPYSKVRYICPPPWLARLTGRVPARSLVYLLVAFRERPDICGGFHLLLNGLVALIAARLTGSRALYISTGGPTELYGGGAISGNRIFRSTGRMDWDLQRSLLDLVNHFDHVITRGTKARRFLRQVGVRVPVEVIPGGIDPQRFSLTLHQAARPYDRPYDMIIVCRLAPIKRLDLFLRVASRVRSQVPSLRAAIVGDGPERQRLLNLAETLDLNGTVDFVGSQDNVAEWLARSRLFVLTSDSEGLALSAIEAMMSGLPCIASQVGDLADLIVDGESGWLVRPRDVEAFAEKILLLLKDRQKLERFSRQARRRALQFSAQAVSRKWLSVLAAS